MSKWAACGRWWEVLTYHVLLVCFWLFLLFFFFFFGGGEGGGQKEQWSLLSLQGWIEGMDTLCSEWFLWWWDMGWRYTGSLIRWNVTHYRRCITETHRFIQEKVSLDHKDSSRSGHVNCKRGSTIPACSFKVLSSRSQITFWFSLKFCISDTFGTSLNNYSTADFKVPNSASPITSWINMKNRIIILKESVQVWQNWKKFSSNYLLCYQFPCIRWEEVWRQKFTLAPGGRLVALFSAREKTMRWEMMTANFTKNSMLSTGWALYSCQHKRQSSVATHQTHATHACVLLYY